MVRVTAEKILVIGDTQNALRATLSSARPAAQITSVSTVFDGLAELAATSFTSILAATEPIERRPESAVKALRQMAGGSRLLLLGHPTLEPLARKMLEFGADDYLVTPALATDLEHALSSTPRWQNAPPPALPEDPLDTPVTNPRALESAELPLGQWALEELLAHPADAVHALLNKINARLAPGLTLSLLPASSPPGEAVPNAIHCPIRVEDRPLGTLRAAISSDAHWPDPNALLAELTQLVGRMLLIQERHNGLQKLAATDDLTGLNNGRFFRVFLNKIVEKARAVRFPVTLLLFDIDNFKQYNDRYGHGVGDDILKQTALLMKRCVRDHDLVARISGDEFAVVFWEKDGPRQALDPKTGQSMAAPISGRPPQTPVQIFARFQRLIASQHFDGLGPQGRGTLTISGGLAVFPYDAHNATDLVDAADKALMFGAKKSGKNSIFLIGGGDPAVPPE